MHGIEQPERLAHAGLQVGLGVLKRLHAPRIEGREITGRHARLDPFREPPADAPRRLDSDRIEAGGDPEALDVAGGAEMKRLIGREALRPIEERADADVIERRNSVQRRLQHRLKMVPVVGKLVEAEILRNAIHAPGFGNRLEGPDQQLAGVLLEIDGTVLVTHDRETRFDIRHGLRYDIEVFGRV